MNRGDINCADGGKVMTKIKFTRLQICATGTHQLDQIDQAASKLNLRGPAVTSAQGIDSTSSLLVPYSNLTVSQGPNCITATFETEIDRCQPYFEAEFTAVDLAGESFTYVNLTDDSLLNNGLYMRRNCDLKVSNYLILFFSKYSYISH